VSTPIVAPFPGYPIGWNMKQHLTHGSAGGDDYEVQANQSVRSIAAGTVHLVGDVFNTVEVHLQDGTGRVIVHEENKTRKVKEGQTVGVGTVLATTGLFRENEIKWPHIHGRTPDGQRHPIDEPGYKTWVTPVIQPGTRIVKSLVAGVYSGASNGRKRVGLIRKGSKHVVKYWTHGQKINGNDIWFGFDSGWVHSSHFTSSSTTNIPEYER
jgi:hypothetical protein